MILTKEECEKALTRLLRPYFAKVDVQNVYHNINKGHSIDEDGNLLTLLIMEHFNNPPLKWDELKENMFVWDNKQKAWIKVADVWMDYKNYIEFYQIGLPYCDITTYDDDRFYRKEVQE